MPLEVITVGGSLAGLMTSIALRRLGHNVRILERAPTPLLHDQGAGIVAGGEIPVFMQKYDRTKTLIAVTSHQRLYLDKTGRSKERENRAQRMTSWDLIYHICRANFDGLASPYVEGHDMPGELDGEGVGRYEHGCAVTKLVEDGHRVRVTYKDTKPGGESHELQHATADFVIIADGSSSTVRKSLCPSSPERTYAGYVAFRGTVPETELSPEAAEVFVEKFPFYHGGHVQILGYTIPGREGTLAPGSRLVNWVWYVNMEGESDEYRQTMTDKDGNTHRWTLPTGGHMQDSVWEARKHAADAILPPRFAELLKKTREPFVQAITDLKPPADKKCWLLGGKAVLAGDALAGFRPHTAASTAQAALHALLLGRMFDNEMDWSDYESTVMRFATDTQDQGVFLGNRSQFGSHPFSE
ncbi:Uu.00g025010.m01.CDS01 [Anthostomella pinea]|uniref:Uu.00g025010.m01.CDS01 n=1 Tax=Anthostomella pinea TaxID=933095 RepID=A0AAI8V7B4_9PEZI|nr:Uu.00g025010.m01.CDS01 [Anthostomella pinea]